jgi:hypothetical protein
MVVPKGTLLGFVERFAGGLRFPQLFWLTAVLFLVDLLIPDLIPFADEVLLGLATLLLGSWKKTRTASPPEEPRPSGQAAEGRVIDVPPEE